MPSSPPQIIRGGFGPIIERTPTPFPFLSRRNNNNAETEADTEAVTDLDRTALTPAEERRQILCGAIQALCRGEPSRPINVRALLFPPVASHPVPANPSTAGETIHEEQTSNVAPTPTNNVHAQNQPPPVFPAALPPPQFNTGMLPHGPSPPVLVRLAKHNTVFLVDSSCHMSEKWSEIGMSIARTTSVILHAIAKSNPSPDDYPYNEEGSVRHIRKPKNKLPATISLYFMDSAVKVRDISKPDTVLRAFDSVAPRLDRAPLGADIFNIVADTFPYPPPNQMPVSARLPLHLIVLTAGYITEGALTGIDSYRSAMDVLAIKDDQVTITLYQVGRNGLSANLLNSYDQVYNFWGSETTRNMVYTEFCQDDHQTISVRSLLRAMSRSMRSRGII